MNFNNVKRAFLIPLIMLIAPIFGCKKGLDVKSTRTVAEVNMWNKLEDARAGLMGIYGLTRAAMVDNNAHWIYGDVRARQFVSPIRQDLKAVIDGRLTASYPTIEALSNWRRWYAVINASNVFLERINDVKKADVRYTLNNMDVDVAQARFLRAFAYFYMVRIWGDVPLIISSHDGSYENKSRNNGSQVLAWAEKELLDIIDILPNRYGVSDPKQPGPYYDQTTGRWDGALARRVSVYGILAHIAAWQGDYTKVAVNTTKLINEYAAAGMGLPDVNHMTSPSGFFMGKNINHLLGFNFSFAQGEAGSAGHIEELTLAKPYVNKEIPDIYIPKDSIVKIFNERGDTRFGLDTIGRPTNTNYFSNFTGRYPVFSKIKVIYDASISPTAPKFSFFASSVVFTRMEDIFMLRAEANAVLGDRASAISDLNVVRTRKGLPGYTEAANGLIIDAIFKERNRELMGEGHLWYDLIRYNKIKQNNRSFMDLIESGGIYWPLSQQLLQQNKLLTQNLYWK